MSQGRPCLCARTERARDVRRRNGERKGVENRKGEGATKERHGGKRWIKQGRRERMNPKELKIKTEKG